MHERAQAEDHRDGAQEHAEARRDVAQHPRSGAKQQGQPKEHGNRDEQFQPCMAVGFRGHHRAADCKREIKPEIKIGSLRQGPDSQPE